LCNGASDEEKRRWSLLGPASSFRVLRSSSCVELADADDAAEYKARDAFISVIKHYYSLIYS
jgi:myosin heavy subunit